MKKRMLDDLTVEITNACNLHCRRCDIWREPKRYELGLAVFKATLEKLLLSFSIGSVSITGGEPFLHPDIEEILKCLAVLQLKQRIVSFGVYTNGACPDIIEGFLARHHQCVQGMTVGISIDGGNAKQHDALRGKGAYKQTMKTLDLLRYVYPNVCNVEIKFTASRINCQELFAVYQLAVSRGFRFTPKIAEDGVSAYYHRYEGAQPSVSSDFDMALGKELTSQMSLVLKAERSQRRKSIDLKMTKMLLQLARKGTGAIRRCGTPRRCLFITSRGEVHPCLYMDPIGNIGGKDVCSAGFFEKREERITAARSSDCPRCVAYHGFLKDINSTFLTG